MQFKKTTLPNGIRVITVPMPGNPTVTVMVSAVTGSFNETLEQSGISHFLEHMCFKGTVKRPTSRIISIELDSIGAAYNAFTTREITGYYAKADAAHFTKIADVIADIYLNPTFPEGEMDREKGVVCGEIDMYADDPQEKIAEALGKHVYKGEPAERDIPGTKESVRALTRDQLVAYHRSQYVGPNTVVTIAGGISENEMLSWAQASFSSLASTNPVPMFLTRDREQAGPETVFIDKDTDQAHLILLWRAMDRNDPDRYIGRVMRSILMGGMSSRLYLKLREELGSGYYINANQTLYPSFGHFSISTGTTHDRVPEIIAAILAETKKLLSDLVPKDELDKVKESIRAHRLMSLEASDDVASFCADQEMFQGKILTPAELDAIYKQITAEDIMRVAKRTFSQNKLTVAAIGKGLDKEAIRSIMSA